MLFIIEGLSMYLSADESSRMLGIIRDNFDKAYVLLECIAPVWVSRQAVEKSSKKTGAAFKWGADSFDESGDIAKGFKKVKDDNILRGMRKQHPFLHLQIGCRLQGESPRKF